MNVVVSEGVLKIKLTLFESALLSALAVAMTERQREILKDQLERFTRVARLIDGDGTEIGGYGYTEFYRRRFFRPVREFEVQFHEKAPGALLAKVEAKFEGGIISVVFKLIHGRLFSMEYRSHQKIFDLKKWKEIRVLWINPNA